MNDFSEVEKMKLEGNEKFKKGDYFGAGKIYYECQNKIRDLLFTRKVKLNSVENIVQFNKLTNDLNANISLTFIRRKLWYPAIKFADDAIEIKGFSVIRSPKVFYRKAIALYNFFAPYEAVLILDSMLKEKDIDSNYIKEIKKKREEMVKKESFYSHIKNDMLFCSVEKRKFDKLVKPMRKSQSLCMDSLNKFLNESFLVLPNVIKDGLQNEAKKFLKRAIRRIFLSITPFGRSPLHRLVKIHFKDLESMAVLIAQILVFIVMDDVCFPSEKEYDVNFDESLGKHRVVNIGNFNFNDPDFFQKNDNPLICTNSPNSIRVTKYTTGKFFNSKEEVELYIKLFRKNNSIYKKNQRECIKTLERLGREIEMEGNNNPNEQTKMQIIYERLMRLGVDGNQLERRWEGIGGFKY